MIEPKLTFGKHKGRTLRSLLNTPEGVSYVRWLARQATMFESEHWNQAAKAALKKAGL